MSRYRKVDPKIWNDLKFMLLSDRGKLAFFFLLTHPHMTALGAMRSSIPGLAAEIGWSEKAFREAFAEVALKGMVKADERSSLIWLPNFLKYNTPESPNVVKAWVNSLDLLPECSLKSELIQCVKVYAKALPEAFTKALPEAFSKAMPYQEQEQEQEQEQKKEGDASAPPPCPHQEIISLYNEILPELPAVIPHLWNGKREQSLQARWRERKARQDLLWWRKLFEHVHENCPFLLGENDRKWKATLGWMIEKEHFTNILEGKYVRE